MHFNETSKELPLFSSKHSLMNFHGHAPSGIFIDMKIPAKLTGGNTLFGIQNDGDSKEPFLKGKVSVVKDGADSDAKAGIAVITMMPFFFGHRGDIH